MVVNTTGASGLDFHLGRNALFWSDVKTKRVRIGIEFFILYKKFMYNNLISEF